MVSIKWQGEGAIAYRVYCNGKLLGQTTDTSFSDHVRGAGPGVRRYAVSPLGWDFEGQQEPAGEINIVPPPRGKAKDAWLDELKPMSQLQDIGVPQPQSQHRRQSLANRRQDLRPRRRRTCH